MTIYWNTMAQYYNKKVRERRFKVGDLIPREIMLATKNPTNGKLGPNWEGTFRVMKFNRIESYHLENLEGKPLPQPLNAEHLRRYYP